MMVKVVKRNTSIKEKRSQTFQGKFKVTRFISQNGSSSPSIWTSSSQTLDFNVKICFIPNY